MQRTVVGRERRLDVIVIVRQHIGCRRRAERPRRRWTRGPSHAASARLCPCLSRNRRMHEDRDENPRSHRRAGYRGVRTVPLHFSFVQNHLAVNDYGVYSAPLRPGPTPRGFELFVRRFDAGKGGSMWFVRGLGGIWRPALVALV